MNDFDKTREALLLFCDGLDAITTQLRRNLSAEQVAFKTADKRETYHDHLNPDLTKPAYDVMKIVWTDAQGAKGPFLLVKEEGQMSDENKHHFNILREALKTAGKSIFGKTEMIWLFQDEKAIGRKQKGAI
jgi:hypothetical protein